MGNWIQFLLVCKRVLALLTIMIIIWISTKTLSKVVIIVIFILYHIYLILNTLAPYFKTIEPQADELSTADWMANNVDTGRRPLSAGIWSEIQFMFHFSFSSIHSNPANHGSWVVCLFSLDSTVLEFNITPTLVVSREKEKRYRTDSRGDERKGQGRQANEWKGRIRRNENIPRSTLSCCKDRRPSQTVSQCSWTPRWRKKHVTFASPNHPLRSLWSLVAVWWNERVRG